MERSEPVKWLIRAVVGLIVAIPLAWLVYVRPEGGYGRWGEAGLYVLAAAAAALALVLSEALIVTLCGAPQPLRGVEVASHIALPPGTVTVDSIAPLQTSSARINRGRRWLTDLGRVAGILHQVRATIDIGGRPVEVYLSPEELSALTDHLADIEVVITDIREAAGLPNEQVTRARPETEAKGA
ncbi:MAG: hypothetical protein FJX75_05800 [Armatimonadetes bacterium]|nr:hypothetical protein [Armatimonadota bacterium]